MSMVETEKTSFKLLPTTISLESELTLMRQVVDQSVPLQTGPLSTGEQSLEMEELSMELKKEEMEDHSRSLLDLDNLSTASILPSQNYIKVITLPFIAQLSTLMEEPKLSPQLTILRFLFGLILNSRSKWLNAMSPHIKLIKQLSILPHTLLLFNHIDASSLDHITNKDQVTLISFWQMLESMELELSLLSISRLTIRINNGFSMIKIGQFITDLIQHLKSILKKENTEE